MVCLYNYVWKFWYRVKFVVIATMPGYKSKSTFIILGEEASTVDFILDPVVTLRDDVLVRSCDCSFDKRRLKLVEFLPGQQSEIFLILIIILLFLCFLMKRRVILNYLRQKQMVGPKRSLVVWTLHLHFIRIFERLDMILFKLYGLHVVVQCSEVLTFSIWFFLGLSERC